MELRTRAIKSTAWYAGIRVCLHAVTWSVGIVLARLLSPADYGLFAMALAAIAFFELFQEFGLGTAIVRHQKLTAGQINAVFWIIFSASVGVTALAFVAAPAAARVFDEPRLVWMIRALGLTFLLNAVGMVPYNLLTRDIDLRRRSLAEAAGTIVSAGVAIAVAWHGHGVWALVAGHVARAFVRNTGMLVACGWFPGSHVSFDGIRKVLRFGMHVAGSGIVATLAGVLNRTVIGRFLGGHDLGMWEMAGSLGRRNPVHKVSTSVINQLSLPVFAKLQSNDDQLRRYFLRISKYLAVLSLPMQVGMALVAHDLVELLLTAKWLPMVPLLQAFCIGGILSVLPLPSAPLLTARGRADAVFRVATVSGVVLSAAVLVGVQWGLVGLITAWLLVSPALRAWLLLLSLREVKLSVGAYLAGIAPAGLAATAMAVVILGLRLLVASSLGLIERLAFDVCIGATVYVATLLLLDRRLGPEMKIIASELLAPSRA
ncbi:MAG: lipopolysaccharide biosynthesis protein [Candidatus Rokuibacteriota bacterium]